MKTKPEWAVAALLFLLLLGIMLHRISHNPRAVLWSDSEGYYKYLPALFILRDFHRVEPGSVWPYYNDRGEYLIKYSCGVAYFELPAFFIAHAIDSLKRGNKNQISIIPCTAGL